MNQGRESSDSTKLVCFHTGLNYDGEYNFPARNYKLDEEFADFVKSQQCKYITKEDGYYIVSREIKGKREIFGKFTTLEFARDFETNLIINSWNNYFPLNVSRFGKYLFKRRGKFYISRTVHGKKRHYESFDNLSDAIKAREELIENNWDFKTFKIKMRCDPYIKINYDTFAIARYIDGKKYDFGLYDSYEDALFVRDILLENNWDYEQIPIDILSSYVFIKYRRFLGEWEIINVIDDVLLSFGLFETRENAKKALNILIDNDWNTATVPLEYYAENSGIRTYNKNKNPYYSVVRRINERVVDFAYFEDKSEAIEFRNKLHFNNWEIEEEEEEEEQFDNFIFYKDNTFTVKNNGVVYGEFDRICDASAFMIECVKNNWRIDGDEN